MTTLKAKERQKDSIGKKFAKKIRNQGEVPAVIYGDNKEPLSISLDPVEYVKQLNHSEYKKNSIFEIEVDGSKVERVITKEINVNPMNNQFIHIDFLRVNDNHPIEINVPIRVEGISAGQRLGGVLVRPKSTIRVSCLPTEIPVDVEVDVTPLTIGENFRTQQISLEGSQTIVSNPKDILVKVESTKVSKLAAGDDAGANTETSDDVATDTATESE